MRKPVFQVSDTKQPVHLQKMARGGNFGFGKKRDCTICVAKTKALISFFVFAYAKSRFSHDAAHLCIVSSDFMKKDMVCQGAILYNFDLHNRSPITQPLKNHF